jgi:hypothetical protein
LVVHTTREIPFVDLLLNGDVSNNRTRCSHFTLRLCEFRFSDQKAVALTIASKKAISLSWLLRNKPYSHVTDNVDQVSVSS